jgi:hypothetical protein
MIPGRKESAEAEVKEAVENYYQAADGEEWAYTYERLVDSETKAMFTKEEWRLKNQWFADNGILRAGTGRSSERWAEEYEPKARGPARARPCLYPSHFGMLIQFDLRESLP